MGSALRFATMFERGAIAFTLVACLLVAIASAQIKWQIGLDASNAIPYFIDEGLPDSGYQSGDKQLAVWALENWSRVSDRRLLFQRVTTEDEALIRVRWVLAAQGQYGEMHPIVVGGRQGAEVFVRPDTAALGSDIADAASSDPLFRDTVVYLTCLHELGHALGLSHTANYDDIMFFFGHGGDIVNFFRRYQEKLTRREDIPSVSGLSATDVSRLHDIYP